MTSTDTGTVPVRTAALAPFSVRSFRFQWPADIGASWAFEMETIILGWYVLTETKSVLMLTLFASLQHMGTLLAPMFGVMGDRIGHRTVLGAMRATYCVLAATLMILAYGGLLTPTYVLCIAGVMGLVRPSDIGMRNALVGPTIPNTPLLAAESIPPPPQAAAQVTLIWSNDGTRLYAAETARDTVAEIDVATGKVLRRIAVGKNGDGLAVTRVD